MWVQAKWGENCGACLCVRGPRETLPLRTVGLGGDAPERPSLELGGLQHLTQCFSFSWFIDPADLHSLHLHSGSVESS